MDTILATVLVVIFVIAVIIIILWFSVSQSKTKGTATTPLIPANAIKYGDTINIFNTNASFGGFMSVCGSATAPSQQICSANVSVLPASSTTNAWVILSTTGISTGTAVKYSDSVFLQSTSNSNNLGYCPSSTTPAACGTSTSPAQNVGTFNSTNSNHSSSQWHIVRKSGTDTYVTPNVDIGIRNTSDGNMLWVCSTAAASGTTSCGFNVTNMNAGQSAASTLSTWQIRT